MISDCFSRANYNLSRGVLYSTVDEFALIYGASYLYKLFTRRGNPAHILEVLLMIVVCDRCGLRVELPAGITTRYYAVAYLDYKGWSASRDHVVCPDCVRSNLRIFSRCCE